MIPASYSRSLLAVGIVGAWVLQDLAALGISDEPEIWIELLPASLAATAIAVAFGMLWSIAAPVAWLTLAGTLLASLAMRQLDSPPSAILLGRAIALMLAAGILGDWLARRRDLPPLQVGFGLGGLASCTFLTYLHTRGSETLVDSLADTDRLALWVLAASICSLAFAMSPSRAIRWTVNSGLVLALGIFVGHAAYQELQLPRSDEAGSASAAATGPNLILIVLDTLRADRLASYGYDRVTTPNLDRFVAERATRYTQSRAASSWTLASHGSLLTGVTPRDHGAISTQRHEAPQPLRRDIPTLAERLRDRGYRTAAVVANVGWLMHEYGMGRGFEHYDDRAGGFVLPRRALVQLAGVKPYVGARPYRTAPRISGLALDWLDRHGEEAPFFLFLNFMEVHRPRIPQPPFDLAYGGGKPKDPLNTDRSWTPLLYDRELAFLDEHLSRFLGGLEERGLMDQTVLVITSDHGDAMDEHGLWHHQKTMYDEEVRVPLFVKEVGPRREAVSERPMTSVDVHDLMLEALDIPLNRQETAEPRMHELYAYARQQNEPEPRDLDVVAWMEGAKKFIVYSDGMVEVYDLESDPAEEHNLVDDQIAVKARAQADRWWAGRADAPAAEQVELSEEALERLRSMGYLQ